MKSIIEEQFKNYNPIIVVYNNILNIKMDKYDINFDPDTDYKTVRVDNKIDDLLTIKLNEHEGINNKILFNEEKKNDTYDNYYDDYDDYDLLNDYCDEDNYKHYINFDELENNLINYKTNKRNNINIPTNLLHNINVISKMIIKEIKTVNSNFDYPHYITLTDRPFVFIINFIFDGIENLELQITFDNLLYPFVPPKLNVLSNYINSTLYHSINNIELFKLENWNFIITLDWIIKNIGNKLENIIYDHIEEEEENSLIKQLVQFDKSIQEQLIVLNHNKFIINKETNTKNHWASGTGYGSGNKNSSWDIKEFIKQQELEIEKQQIILHDIDNNINDSYFYDPILLNFISNKVNETSIIDINKYEELYISLHSILNKIIYNYDENYKPFFIDILSSISNYINEINRINNHDNKIVYDIIINNYNILDSKNIISVEEEKKEEDENNDYDEFIKDEQDKMFDDYEIQQNHRFYKNKPTVIKDTVSRIMSELNTLQSSLPNYWDTTIIFRSSDEEFYKFSFVITGPKDTPYHNGIFEFHGLFPNDYPNSPPKILINTTGNGTVRYNPNLYASGKVCLSLLGTWSGDETEKWNSNTSTLLQVLISIQSLIFVDEPYFNEPGYERSIGSSKGNESSFNYNDKVRFNTLKWAMVEQFKNPPYGFEDFTNQYFIFKKDEINEIVSQWINESKKYKNEMIQLLDEFNSLF